MANLDIQIKGLALCHLESGDNWRVFFPKAHNHDFKIVVEKFKSSNGDLLSSHEYRPPTATRIDLVASQTKQLTAAKNDVNSSIDLFALHDEPITLTDELEKYAGFLTLHGAILKSRAHPDSPLEVDIWDSRQPVTPPTKQDPPTKEWVDRKNVATEFLTSFETDSNSSVDVTMRTDFEIKSESVLSIKQEDGVTCIVTFSNDCEGMNCETESDFKFFYEIIDESKLKTKRRFELILVDPDAIRGRLGSPCGGGFVPEGELNIPGGLQ